MNVAGVPSDPIIILGHNGFIGSSICDSIKRSMPGVALSGFSMPEYNLTREDDVKRIFQQITATTILIICSGIKKQWGDNLDTYAQNMQMALNLCRTLEEKPVKQVIFYSSADVYGEETDNSAITENTPVQPTSFYGLAKYASERLLMKVTSAHRASLCILRPPLVFGAGDTSYGYGPSGFIKSGLLREKITLWGDGTEKRQFIYIKDLADLTCALVKNPFNGVLNVTDGQSASFKDILRILSDLLSYPIAIDSRPRTKAKVDNAYSNNLLKSALPAFCFTPLAQGLKDTLETMRAALESKP